MENVAPLGIPLVLHVKVCPSGSEALMPKLRDLPSLTDLLPGLEMLGPRFFSPTVIETLREAVAPRESLMLKVTAYLPACEKLGVQENVRLFPLPVILAPLGTPTVVLHVIALPSGSEAEILNVRVEPSATDLLPGLESTGARFVLVTVMVTVRV